MAAGGLPAAVTHSGIGAARDDLSYLGWPPRCSQADTQVDRAMHVQKHSAVTKDLGVSLWRGADGDVVGQIRGVVGPVCINAAPKPICPDQVHPIRQIGNITSGLAVLARVHSD